MGIAYGKNPKTSQKQTKKRITKQLQKPLKKTAQKTKISQKEKVVEKEFFNRSKDDEKDLLDFDLNSFSNSSDESEFKNINNKTKPKDTLLLRGTFSQNSNEEKIKSAGDCKATEKNLIMSLYRY